MYIVVASHVHIASLAYEHDALFTNETIRLLCIPKINSQCDNVEFGKQKSQVESLQCSVQ